MTQCFGNTEYLFVGEMLLFHLHGQLWGDLFSLLFLMFSLQSTGRLPPTCSLPAQELMVCITD